MAQPSPLLSAPDADALVSVIERVRTTQPRVHALTSPVAAERTANTLLALGAAPSLTSNAGEIAAFVEASHALLINLGMLDPAREAAIAPAVLAARRSGRRWVLDPVFADVSPMRRTLALSLLAQRPDVLKSNSAESPVAERVPEETVVAITGPVDRIRLGARALGIANGHPLAASVTAMGCAAGAVIAACLAVEEDAFLATTAALAHYAIACERAAEIARGPGSFAVAVVDALAGLDPETFSRSLRIVDATG